MRIFSIEYAGRTFVIAPEQAMTYRPGCLRNSRLTDTCRPPAPRYA
jgi:hypothetical protein